MKNKKFTNIDCTFVVTQNPDKSYYRERYLVCGKKDMEQFKVLVKFNINHFKDLYSIKDNVKKVELCLYLSEINIEDYTDNYMINIGINIEDFDISNITYNNSPRCSQKSCMYIMNRKYNGNYVNMDITNIVKEQINKGISNIGMTLIGINEKGYVIFNSSDNDNCPYIRISYERDPEIVCKNNESDIKLKENNINDQRYYGYFINVSGNLLKLRKYNLISWDNKIIDVGMSLDKNKTSIIVEHKGIYQVDFGINMRSNTFTYMMISLNGNPVQCSMVQIGRQEHMVSGNIIIDIPRDNTQVSLMTKKTEMILSNIGISSYLRIIKI